MSNVSFDREAFERALSKHGATDMKGKNAILHAFSDAVKAAAYNSDVTADKAAHFYEIYARGAASVKGVAYERATSFPQQVSKFGNGLKLGMLHNDTTFDMIDFTERALTIIREYGNMSENPMKGGAYENLQKLAVQQLSDTFIGSPLSDEQIRDILTQEGKEKSVLDKLIAAYKSAVKLQELDMNSDAKIEVENSAHAYAAAIKAMGGEIPASKEEKAQDRALAALMKKLPAGFRIAAE